MAYKQNSIASATVTHSFITLLGAISLAHESTQVIGRANVAGIDTLILPVKGRPFALISVASCTSETDALAKYQSYCNLIGVGLVTLVRNDVNFHTTFGQKAKVLDVAFVEVQIASSLVGNVSPSDTHLLTCQWMLALEVPGA